MRLGNRQTLTFTFDGPTHLTSVGLIGGYVKVDPLTGVDRFPQNRRVKQVRWTFSDGSTVVQDLADSRSMQTINVDVTTTSATMEILATYPPRRPRPAQCRAGRRGPVRQRLAPGSTTDGC